MAPEPLDPGLTDRWRWVGAALALGMLGVYFRGTLASLSDQLAPLAARWPALAAVLEAIAS